MPRPPSDHVQITVRIPEDWIARANQLAPKMSEPGLKLERADVYRRALAIGLDALEAATKKPKK